MPLDQIDVDKQLMKGEKEMSFLDHLEELRWNLIRAVSSILIFGIIIFVMKEFFFDMIVMGPMRADFPTYNALTKIGSLIGFENFVFEPPKSELEAIAFTELFLTHLKVSLMMGFIISFPYVFWEIWKFVKPGLYEKEAKAARGIVWVCSLLFFVGVLFGYFIIAPFALNFFGNYELAGIASRPSLSSYVDTLTMLTIPTGLVFELPIVIYFLSKIGLVTPEFMRQYRKHAFVLMLVGAAIITPPDVMTQLLISVPLYFLYEASILISKRVNDKRKSLDNE